MAWSKVSLIEDELSEQPDGRAAARRRFYAANTAVVTCDAALAASHGGTAVPARGASYSGSRPTLVCQSRRVERITGTQFYIEATFEDRTDGATEENLLLQAARVSVSYEGYLEDYSVDAEGEAVRNRAGEPFETLPQRAAGIKVYSIRKFVDATGKAAIEASRNTTNDASQSIDGQSHAIDTLWLSDCTFALVEGHEGPVYEAVLTVKYKPEGWTDTVLNVGYTELVNDGGTMIRQRIKEWDEEEQREVPVSKPWPLSETGAKLPDGDDELVELVYYPYPQDAWTGVPLT
jgi:hypothetical protein